MSNNFDLMAIPAGNLDAYRHAVNTVPMLSPEEEHDLAVRYRESEDREAAWQLVTSHLRFVVKVARGYSGYGLAEADLVQEGNIGLMKAVKRFDPELGVRLVSFAVHWIRAEIHEFILRNWRIVKVATTKPQRKLFFNLRSAKKRLGWMSMQEVNEVAKDLGVSSAVVLEMEQRLNAHDQAFDIQPDSDGETERFAPAAFLQDSRFEPSAQVEAEDWDEHMSARLGTAMSGLDERSKIIVSERWLSEDKTTLQDLADRFGVSAERIRQLEKNAFAKLRKQIES